VLKDERQQRILEILEGEGRVVAADLPVRLGVSGHTVRRDLEELSAAGSLRRIHGGAVPRSLVADTYARRERQSVAGKTAVARAAVALLPAGGVSIVDGGTTALHLVDEIPAAYAGTIVTHSPLVAARLAARGGPGRVEVVLVGGLLDQRAMVAVGAQTIRAYERVSADVCFLGVWSVSADGGVSSRYPEEAEVRATMVGRADRVVGLATRDKIGTVAAFRSAPATALTHLAVEPATAPAPLAALEDLGILILR
jgi:DeoR/GlpR family transcriptional regulator of sugar metabolism